MDKFEALLEQLSEQTKAINKLADNQGDAQKSAFSDTSADTQFPRGAQSIWGGLPVERDVLTAHIRPEGLASRLPFLPSVTETPYFGIITGVTDEVGTEATNPCEPNPTGFMKACTLTAQFGRLARDTNTIDIDKVMLKYSRGDFTDYRLHGQMLGMNNQTPSRITEADFLNVVTKAEMVIAGVNIERKLATQLWQGSPSNNTSGGGYKEFPGLDNQITTGHVDVETNTACPAVDSDVKNFGYDEVGGSGRDIVEYLSMLEFYLRNNARKMGLSPVQWVVVMRPELWFELSAVWPCNYLSHRCTTDGSSNPVVINDNVNVNLRDDMRNSSYIDINGNRYPVIVDDGIFEHNNINNGSLAAGEYASSIYFLPLTIAGGFPVTYIEHVDYRAASADIALLNSKERFWTDDGIFMWTYEQNRFCYLLSVKTEQRVVLRAPHLAGKIDAVKYSPLQHLRQFDPSDPYYVNGGVSTRGLPFNKNATWLS